MLDTIQNYAKTVPKVLSCGCSPFNTEYRHRYNTSTTWYNHSSTHQLPPKPCGKIAPFLYQSLFQPHLSIKPFPHFSSNLPPASPRSTQAHGVGEVFHDPKKHAACIFPAYCIICIILFWKYDCTILTILIYVSPWMGKCLLYQVLGLGYEYSFTSYVFTRVSGFWLPK